MDWNLTLSVKQSYYLLLNTQKQGKSSTDFIVRKVIATRVDGYNADNDQIISVRLCRQLFYVTIIQIYVLTIDTEKKSFMIKFNKDQQNMKARCASCGCKK